MDELIVDSRRLDEVVTVLTDRLRVLPDNFDHETDERLGLTRVGSLRLDDYVTGARQRYGDELPPDDQLADVDLLVYDLRRTFADTRGYVPVLDRDSDDVEGEPQHKSVGPPTPAGGVEIPPGCDGAGVIIEVIDTPLARHDDLPPDLVLADTVYDGANPTIWAGHGTFVAGVIRRQAPGATIRMRGALSSDGGTCSRWDLAKHIAACRGIDILNLSLGFRTFDDAVPPAIARALSCLDPRVLVVAAAGNGPDNRRVWPGAFGPVIDVGSAGGPALAWIDTLAQGSDVTSTYLHATINGDTFTGYATWNGTSFAAAQVSGAVAATMTRRHVDTPTEAYGLLPRDLTAATTSG